MGSELATTAKDSAAAIMERVLLAGDLKSLKAEDRMRYYNEVCSSVGLNPLTTPFEYLTLSGKMVLYAKKSCTDQLRSLHGVSIVIVSREQQGDIYIVSARATNAAGRTDEDVGAVTIGAAKGENLCNALMKAETKAKRRVTLSICGLGMLDETEVGTIPGAEVVPLEKAHETKVETVQKPADVKSTPYSETFLDLVDLALIKRDLGAETKAAFDRAMAQLMKQHQMDHNNVTPEVGGRLIQAITDGKFDKAKAAAPKQEVANV